jgi:hypothetical protein
MARFRTHDLTKELAYVRTQPSGQDTMDTKMIYNKCVELARLEHYYRPCEADSVLV